MNTVRVVRNNVVVGAVILALGLATAASACAETAKAGRHADIGAQAPGSIPGPDTAEWAGPS